MMPAMAFLCRVIILLFLVELSSALTCRLKSIEDGGGVIDPDSEMCAYKQFTGPVGDVIATAQSTKLSKYALSHGKGLVDTMASFASLIPVVGGYVSVALTQMSNIGFEGTGDVINRILGEIEGQMQSLITYVDQVVQELEYTQLKQKLEGMLAAARSCAEYDRADQITELKRCLISLSTMIIGNVGRFLPENDNIIAFDWVLPLFRQYADLQLTVTQDQLRIAINRDETSNREDYINRLKRQATEFYDFSVSSVNRIVHVHTNFNGKTCTSRDKWGNEGEWNAPFGLFEGYMGTCSQVFFRNRLCREEMFLSDPDGEKLAHNRGQTEVRNKVGQCIDAYAATVKDNLRRDLRKYWKMEIIDIAEEWKKIAEKADDIPSTKKHRKKKV